MVEVDLEIKSHQTLTDDKIHFLFPTIVIEEELTVVPAISHPNSIAKNIIQLLRATICFLLKT